MTPTPLGKWPLTAYFDLLLSPGESLSDAVEMLTSQVSPEASERIKKRFYIGEQDEYNCSSEPLNGRQFETSVLTPGPRKGVCVCVSDWLVYSTVAGKCTLKWSKSVLPE